MKTARKTTAKHSKPIPLTSIPLPNNTTITELDLSYNTIQHMSNLNKLEYLTTLNLSYNRITKIQNIFGLEMLENIILNNNLIEYIPKEMGVMKGIKMVDVSNNRILFIHGISALEGKQLKQFRVDGNRVTKRPKFQQTFKRITENDNSKNTQILQMQYLTTEPTFDNIRQPIPMTTSIQLLGTFRSIYEVQQRSAQQPHQSVGQFQSLLELKDRDLSDKKISIIQKHNQIMQFPSRSDIMLQNDRPYLQNDDQIVKVVGKFILDTSSVCKTIVSLVNTEVERILESFQSYNVLEESESFMRILLENQLEYESVLKVLLNSSLENGLNDGIDKIKEYAGFYNSLRSSVKQMDALVLSYVHEFNHLYQIIELKTVLEQNLDFSNQMSPQQSKEQRIISLETQIQASNQVNQQLITQNNTFIETIQKLQSKIQAQQTQIIQLRERWNKLEEIKQQSNILLDNLMQKQHAVIAVMQEKLTGDFFQNLILNQAQTIQMLIATNKSLKEKVYLQESNDIVSHPKMTDNQYLLTMVETGKKKIQRTSQQYSSQSNLLSDRPNRNRPQLPLYPINYFSKSMNLLKSKNVSVPTTYRDEKQTRYTLQTQKNEKMKKDIQNPVGRKILFTHNEIEESQSYKEYRKYYLRNSIIDILIDKSTNKIVKSRYDSKDLRLRKFKEISGKRILRRN